MYVDFVPNRGSKPTVLLREGWREGNKVRKRTIANITSWPPEKIELIRRLLKDEPLMSPDDVFSIARTLPHGHVEAVLGTIRKLGLDKLIASKRSRERDLCVAMLAQRVLDPASKLETTSLWHTSTLAEELGVDDADEDDLYEAMDWLLARQQRIESKLAKRHLSDNELVLYDVSSSYYEGRTCPLARFGHNRDGKKGKRIIVYGMLTDKEGRPVAIEVYPGNTGDPTTVPDQVEKLRNRFGLERIVLVGDRGMLTQTQINKLEDYPGIGWLSALKSKDIRKLFDTECLQLSLFDERNLAEISSPDFPNERLVVCHNPLLAEERRRKREDLLQATEKELQRIRKEVARRTKKPLSAGEIGKKVGKVINRYKMAKHFEVTITDGHLTFHRRQERIEREAQMDGIYVIRTSEPNERLSAEDSVRGYKSLSHVERAFRTLKGLDLLIRPIYHREATRVRAHIFLCMLAYYVVWHMRKALAPLLFSDDELDENRAVRDPVAPATPSESAKRKKRTRRTLDGFPVHDFRTLLKVLATRARNRCRMKTIPNMPLITRHTDMTPLQERAFDLLGLLPG